MDRWIEGFEANGTYFDTSAKELVQVTNGTCTLDHSSPEGYAVAHNGGGCRYTPSEAIALRVVGVTHNGDPIIAFTYRRVAATTLQPMVRPIDANTPSGILARVRRSRKIGRV